MTKEGPVLQVLRFAAVSAVVSFVSQLSLAQVVQLPIPYNADVVREPGGTVTGGGIDPPITRFGPGGAETIPGGRGFVTQAEAAANDPVDPHGLPDSGVLVVPGGTVQLGPYNGNNAFLLTTSPRNVFGYGAGVLTGFDTLDIYAAGQGAIMGGPSGVALTAFIDYAAGNGFAGAGMTWDMPAPSGATFGTTSFALSGMDRTGPGGAGFEDVDGVHLIRWPIPIRGGSPLNGVSFSLNPPSGVQGADWRVAVLAATVTRVPEPSTVSVVLGAAVIVLLRRRR